ncbi:MAG TPA: CBS domain-containing protein [Ktedonobacteraceae bacterium]|nr:CBS domain-containing protein [Ktedonobacteraceae bacterium]
MIVSEVMTTRLVTVTADDTLSHAANLFRQYQFHHLPVVKEGHSFVFGPIDTKQGQHLIFEGMLTTQDIDVAAAVGTSSSDILHRPWQERRVGEIMQRATIRVSPTTSVAAAAQILVERGLNCLPVVEYEPEAQDAQEETAAQEARLVGLLTRSDLLIALARALGAFEPGMQLVIPLPTRDLTPLARTLQLAAELHIQVRSVLAAPLEGPVPLTATIRLGTIHPAPLLIRLQEESIDYSFVEAQWLGRGSELL